MLNRDALAPTCKLRVPYPRDYVHDRVHLIRAAPDGQVWVVLGDRTPNSDRQLSGACTLNICSGTLP